MTTSRKTSFIADLDDNARSRVEKHKIALLYSIEASKCDCEEIGEKLYYENQETTAIDIAKNIISTPEVVFQLVIAETQAGKTGCMIATIEKIFHLSGCDPIINPKNIFILTGISSHNWLIQTGQRMPNQLSSNVYHRNTLKELLKLQKKIKNMRDILIIMDEVHIASQQHQSIDKLMRSLGFKDMDVLREKNINFIEFSATPNNILQDINHWGNYAKIHIMSPGIGYNGFDTLIRDKRIYQAHDLYIADDCSPSMTLDEHRERHIKLRPMRKAIRQLKRHINEYEEPKYHIIRTPKGDKRSIVEERVKHIFGKYYNYCYCSSKNDDELLDIIKNKPTQHTIIFIIELLRCAVTLRPKKHIGILYERIPTGKIMDYVMVQSLAGRACGYDVPNSLVVYTNIQSIKNYVEMKNKQFNDVQLRRTTSKKITHIHPDGYNNTGIKVTKINKQNQIDYKVFDNFGDLQKFAKNKFKTKTTKPTKVPHVLKQSNGDSPTLEYVLNRKWGLSKTIKFRRVLLNNGLYCIYWYKNEYEERDINDLEFGK